MLLAFDGTEWNGFGQRMPSVVKQQHAFLLDVRIEVVAALKVFIQVLDVFDDYRGAGAVKSKPTQTPADGIANRNSPSTVA